MFKNRIKALFSRLISLPVALIVFLLGLLYLVENIALRYFMLKKAESLSKWTDPLKATRGEMLWLAVLGVLVIIGGSSGSRVLRRIVIGGYVFIIAVALMSIFIHFAVFAVTGTGLTRDYILHWLSNTSDVNRMIAKEIRPATILVVVLQIILIMAVLMVPKIKIFKIPASGRAAGLKRRTIVWAALSCLLVAVGVMAPPLSVDANDALYAVPIYEVFGSVIPDNNGGLASVEILPEERMDDPIVLSRSSRFRPLNIVLIIFESLNWKHSDVYTPGLGTTPFLKELARESLVIDRMYSVVPHTSKALVPILGGFYPYLGMDVEEALPGLLPERGLAHILSQFGYRTAFFQTASNYEARAQLVSNLGFETFRSLESLPQEGFAEVNYFGREERLMLQPSLDWVEQAPAQPFFLTYLTLSTHHGYGTAPEFPEVNYTSSDPNLNRFLNAVRFTDGFIKDVISEFRRRGLAGNTVFMIIGDHGEAFGEHGLRGHNFTLWDEGMRVLGMIYAPAAIKEPGHIRGLRSTLDVAPTVCDLIGLEVKEGKFIGQSFLQPVPESRQLFFSGWSSKRVVALKEDKMKCISWPALNRFEVYNNANDPHERHNLVREGRVSWAYLEAISDRITRWVAVVNAHYHEWKQNLATGAR